MQKMRELISKILNYPNPFSTSTKFVFTITGDEIPEEMISALSEWRGGKPLEDDLTVVALKRK